MPELLISVFCILLILYMGRTGAMFGLFFEMTSTLLLVFATLVTLRYWYPFTRFVGSMVPISGAYAAFVGYWALFLIGCIPLLVVMRMVNEDARPKYPNFLDNILGFLFGMASAAVFVCAVMTSLSVIVPKLWDGYEPAALLVRFDTLPITSFQKLEQNFFSISDKDPTHTRLPTFEKADADNFDKYWR